MTESKTKLGVALGGGGSRAFVHLGILSVLEAEGIAVQAVSGSSMGAVLGAMYAFTPDAAAVRATALDYFLGSRLFGMNPKPAKRDGLKGEPGFFAWLKKFAWTMSLSVTLASMRGLFRRNAVHDSIDALVPDETIEHATLPFCCNALNMTDGELAVFNNGPVRNATKAGTAVGILYKPYCWDGIEYADAAPVSSVPARACRALGADVVLAVDIRTPPPKPFRIMNGFDVMQRVEMIQSATLNGAECAAADFVLKPDVGDVFWGDFTRLDEVVKIGEDAMRARLPELREMFERRQ